MEQDQGAFELIESAAGFLWLPVLLGEVVEHRWAGQWHMGSSEGAAGWEHGAGTSALHP